LYQGRGFCESISKVDITKTNCKPAIVTSADVGKGLAREIVIKIIEMTKIPSFAFNSYK